MSHAQGSSEGIASLARRAWRGARWVLLVAVVGFIGLVIYRIPAVGQQQQSADTVARIQSQHLTLADVDGTHLPPPPDPAQVDATVAGVDANGNGIRDDVELAIFKKYPNNTQLRAAELQYAMALQTGITLVFDQQTWVTAIQEKDRAFGCLYDISNTGYSSLQQEVEDLEFNTSDRIQQRATINQWRTSYKLLSGSDCDVMPT